ncbi:hypothetical protein CSUI_011227 [Cystoisospora suis]|uniref:Uncharacterized protein n=1 Tax=Cystoisospora suis TaxID=483139 RepID=A0A2C6KEI4_9APIC|nr:hypothetical protein CSUI_011227 [Cystoisospora suis]
MQQLLEEEGYQRPEEGWRTIGLEDERGEHRRGGGGRTPSRVTFGGRLEKKKKHKEEMHANRQMKYVFSLPLRLIHLDDLPQFDPVYLQKAVNDMNESDEQKE